EDEPYHLKVSSRVEPGEFVEYGFTVNRSFQVALPLSQRVFSHFEEAGWALTTRAFEERLKLGSSAFKEGVPNLSDYVLLRPPRTESFVKVITNSYRFETMLVFLCDNDMRVIASGFVSLYTP